MQELRISIFLKLNFKPSFDPNFKNMNFLQTLKLYRFRPFAPRRPPILPTPSTRRISTAGDHRYVSFYRGQIGGQSWGYSYHL